MAGVFHCGDCAGGPRPLGIFEVTREGSIADPVLSQPGGTLLVSAVAHLFLLAAHIRISLYCNSWQGGEKNHGTRLHHDDRKATQPLDERRCSTSGNRPGPRRAVSREPLSTN